MTINIVTRVTNRWGVVWQFTHQFMQEWWVHYASRWPAAWSDHQQVWTASLMASSINDNVLTDIL